MSIEFHYGAGSPYAWRVCFALEHKLLDYERKVHSAEDLRTAAFLALNPRGEVPVLVDRGFVLYESAAILEYLDEAYEQRPLLPREVKPRAIARRMIREADEYLASAMEAVVDEVLLKPREAWDLPEIHERAELFRQEIGRFEAMLAGQWFAGSAGAVDYSVYPLLALGLRVQKQLPELGIQEAIGPRLFAWMERMQGLPFYGVTVPPHWKSGEY